MNIRSLRLETPEQRRCRLAWEAKSLPVPATSDANPPTYGGLLALCETLQLIGGHTNLTDTMLTAIRDAQTKIAEQKRAEEPTEK